MVIRLFVPLGEGQDELVPKRPTVLGANATVQYAVFSSTGLAAVYASFAARHGQRIAPNQSASRTALFIRSSARLGLWAGAVGAAVNYYYHSSFTSTVLAHRISRVKSWKVYKRTKEYTVDDACLAGATLGLTVSIPMLLLRRPNIPRWACSLGLANIGACAGMLGAHGYLQYTGLRQKAYKRLDKRLQRRASAFWFIFWDKELMARLDPLWQHYVRHQGIWYNQLLPDDGIAPVTHQPPPTRKARKSKVIVEESSSDDSAQDDRPFYTQPFDYEENLKQIDVDGTLVEMEKMMDERATLLAEADYLLSVNAIKQYAYCNLGPMDDEERRRRQHEIQLVEIAYNRLAGAAHSIDLRLVKWQLSLQHKALRDSTDPKIVSNVHNWLPRSHAVNFAEHRPAMALGEMERFGNQIAQEVKRFEELSVDPRYTASQRERWRKDLEDGRLLLQAADQVAHELRKTIEDITSKQGVSSVEEGAGRRQDAVTMSSTQSTDPKTVEERDQDKNTIEDLPEPQKTRLGEVHRGQEKMDRRSYGGSKIGPNKP